MKTETDHVWENSPIGGTWCKNCGKDRFLLQLDPELSRVCARTSHAQKVENTLEDVLRSKGFVPLAEAEQTTQHLHTEIEHVSLGQLGPGAPRYEQETPPEASEAEREHCERVAREWHHTGWTGPLRPALTGLLLSERAAADKAGYERGREVGREQEEAAFDRGRKTERDYAFAHFENAEARLKELTKLQSRYERLASAARELLRCYDGGGEAYNEEEPPIAGLRAALKASSSSESEGEGKS